MPQLEKLQSKNNALAIMVVAMGACIKEVRECSDPFEAAERMHTLVEAFEATVDAFERFGDDMASILDKYMQALSGGTDAGDELH